MDYVSSFPFLILLLLCTKVNRFFFHQEYCGGEYCRRGDAPAFGSGNWNDAVPFTQCFETATTQQPAILHYAPYTQDRDLYLEDDLYDNHHHHHLVSPAVIVLPRRRVLLSLLPTYN